MKIRFSRAVISSALLIAGAIFLAMLITNPFPSDADLVSTFLKHKRDFEALVRLAENNRIADGKYNHNHGGLVVADDVRGVVSDEEYQLYKELMLRTGAKYFSSNKDIVLNKGEYVSFFFYRSGVFAIGEERSKGVVHIIGDIPRYGSEVDSLDDAGKYSEPGVYLKKIDDLWYIFYSISD